jgi:hypothetical protein
VGTELERRFLLHEDLVRGVLSLLDGHIAAEIHDQVRPRSFTKTTYLDTSDLEYLRSYYRPLTRRLRVRQYASSGCVDDLPVFSSPCYLELKETYGLTRDKIRFSMSPQLLPRLLDGTHDLGDLAPEACQLHPQLGRVVAQLKRGLLRPVLTTWYRRHTFVGEAGRVRLTFDQNLVYAQEAPQGQIGRAAAPTCVLGAGPAWVFEVKCRGETPGWLKDVIIGLPESREYSKYRAGMEMFHRRRVAA